MTLAKSTRDMTVYELRRLVGLILRWAGKHMGAKKIKYRVLTQRTKCKIYYGEFRWDINTLYVYRNNCPTVKHIITTVLHEYRHAQQDLSGYHQVLEKVGYRKHPLEIEARQAERLYSACWKSIKKKYKLRI